MKKEEALPVAIELLKERKAGYYGYDYFPNRIAWNVARNETNDAREEDQKTREYYPFFADAGWVLCQRGILRPGVKDYGGQAVPEGGYSLTLTGADKVKELDETSVLLFQSSSLMSTFVEFGKLYGDGFVQRANEAVQCRDAALWYSSCVMSGAAAEAVLIATAIGKKKNREDVLKAYRAAGGRKKVLDMVTGGANAYLQSSLKAFSGIIGAWRDDAGHGAVTNISAANADEALRQLLHMCQWVQKEWENLTK